MPLPTPRTLVLTALGAGLLGFAALPLLALLPRAGDLGAVAGEGLAARNTALLALGALLVALGTGAPVGWALARARLPRWLTAACTLPYAIPPYVTTIAWITLANPTNGLLRAWLPVDVYTLPGMAWVLGLHLSPFVSLSVRDALGAIDPSLEEAARVSGAGWGRTLRDVTLPMLAPALGTAWFLVFVPSLCEVTLSVLLRGPSTEVLGTRLFTLQSYADPQSAAVLAVMVAGLVLAGLGLARGGAR